MVACVIQSVDSDKNKFRTLMSKYPNAKCTDSWIINNKDDTKAF